MPKFYESISDDLRDWAMAQSVFFTASAPLNGAHVNISPKGLPLSSFRVFGPNAAAYIDFTGSGSETIAHLYENGRVTIMFCSFGPSPRIMRFFCKGRVVECDQPAFGELAEKLLEGRERSVDLEAARAVIWLDVFKVQTSCGFGVPLLATAPVSTPPSPPLTDTNPSPTDPTTKTPTTPSPPTAIFQDRDTLGHWANKKIAKNTMHQYRAANNARSLDGCPGLRAAIRTKGDTVGWVLARARVRRVVLGQWEGVLLGMVLTGLLLLMSGMVGSEGGLGRWRGTVVMRERIEL